MEDAAGDTMTRALEAIHGLPTQTSPSGRSLRRDHRRLMFRFLAHRHRRCLGSLYGVHVDLLLSILASTLVAKLHLALPLGVEHAVPEDKEGLGEVGLDAPALVVDVMVGGIVGGEMLQGVPREGVSAVIVHGLDGRHGKEPHGLAVGHAGNQEPDASTGGIQEKSFHRVVVECSESVGDIEAMVSRVEGHWGKV